MVNFKAWAATHHKQLAVGGAAGAGVIALMAKKRSASTSSSSAGATGTTAASSGTAVQGTGDPYDETSDVYNSIEPQLEALQAQIAGLSSGAASPAPTAAASSPSGGPVAPSPTSSPAPAPANQYAVGQAVGNGGEKIVQEVLDQTGQGYYDLTNYGGVYTSGDAKLGSKTPGGSFLGYLATLAPSQQKLETPGGPGTGLGNFSQGKITANPGGGYTIVDDTGNSYTF